MTKKVKPIAKVPLTDDNGVTRQLVVSNYGKACRAIGIPTNPHVTELLRGKDDDGDLFILEGDDVGTVGPGTTRALVMAIMIHGIGPGLTNGPYTPLRYVRIWKQQLKNEGAAAISNLLPFASGLTIAYLELLDCGLGFDGCKALAKVLALPKTPLLTLKLDFNLDIGDAGLNVLVDGLFLNSVLKRLHLDYANIGPSGCVKLAQLLSLPTCAIETLSLQGNTIQDEGLSHLSLGLARSQKLVTLNLSDNGIRSNIEALTAFRDALVRSKALAHVDFTLNLIEPQGGQILLPALAPDNSKLLSFLVDSTLPRPLFLQLHRARKTGNPKKSTNKGSGKPTKK